MRRAAAALLAALLLGTGITGCTATVSGTGHLAADGSAPPPSGSAPSAGGAPGNGAPQLPSCPTVHDPLAHLTYTCISTGMTFAPGTDDLWPVAFTKMVEAATSWTLDEGSGDLGPSGGKSLAALTRAVRARMIDNGGYGDKPTLSTVASNDMTVGGVAAHLLLTTVTINHAWAVSNHTKVTSERLWLVALQASADDVSLWYVSIPNLASNLWARVPAVIASIKVA